MIKMIATDIDGTMLRSDRSLSTKVRRSLWAAEEAGIHVVPATGRPMTVATEVIDALGLPGYWVFSNGAITFHAGNDEVLRGYWIDHSTVSWVITALRSAIPDVEFALEGDRSAVHEAGFRTVVPTVPDSYRTTKVGDVTDHFPDRIQKVLVFRPDVDIEDLYARVSDVTRDKVVASYSGMNFVELSASFVTKARALAELATQLGIDQSEVAAFGDNHNDIPMLEWAGQSYAMGNASIDAKESADHVIKTNDEDGLAQAVDRLVEQALQ